MLQQNPGGAARLGEKLYWGVARGGSVSQLGHQPAGQGQRVSLPGQTLRVSARLLQVRPQTPDEI